MANQTSIPVIQNADQSVVLLQQNANKVLRNLNNQIVQNTTDISQMTILGEIKLASLTLLQFQAIAGTNWILANGQSSVGTSYETLTGNKTVPTIIVAGSTAFIKVN
jgi:hypothetical protein